jgi:hypothetical protein
MQYTPIDEDDRQEDSAIFKGKGIFDEKALGAIIVTYHCALRYCPPLKPSLLPTTLVAVAKHLSALFLALALFVAVGINLAAIAIAFFIAIAIALAALALALFAAIAIALATITIALFVAVAIALREDVVAELILMVNPLYRIMSVAMLNYEWYLALRSFLGTSGVWPK